MLGELVQRAAGSFAECSTGGGNARRLPPALASPCSLGVVLLLYRFVPARGLQPRDGLAGALVTALLLQLISFASGLIYDKTTNLSVVYGSLTAALVFLYSVYLYASALLLGRRGRRRLGTRAGPPGRAIPCARRSSSGVLGLFVSRKEPPEGGSWQVAGHAM